MDILYQTSFLVCYFNENLFAWLNRIHHRLALHTEKSQPEGKQIMPETWPRGYKTFFMLNSVEHEIFPAHKC